MHQSPSNAAWRSLLALLVAIAPTAVAQSAAGNGTISGTVIDASSGQPLLRVTVALTAVDGFGLLSAQNQGWPLGFARSTTTSSKGEYRFSELAVGAYRLHLRRVGYSPATIEVRLGEIATSPVSIGLVVAPIRLRVVEVRASNSGLGPSDEPPPLADRDRVDAALARQRAFLSTDARELTTLDVAESATLGGRDVLRTLQRLPGVTQLDDWSAKLWVRGNRWDHNRLYYDDLPLFDPLEALGRTSGVSADAIGAAFIHPGVRPVSLGGEGATRIDLRSRSTIARAGDARYSAELSRFGATASVTQARDDGRAGIAVTARHTLAEWLPPAGFLGDVVGSRGFSDAQVSFRSDVVLDSSRRFETSGLLTRDTRGGWRLSGDKLTTQQWGNAAGRATFYTPLGPFFASQTVGITHFASSSSRYFVEVDGPVPASDRPIDRPVTSSVDYVTVGGRAGRSTATSATQAGYDVTMQRSSLAGSRGSILWGDLSMDDFVRRDVLSYGTIWGQHRMTLGERFTIDGGLRFDLGGTSSLPGVRPQGSLQARVAARPGTLVSFGVSRTQQYVQGIELPIVARGETSPALWLTAGKNVPAMVTDNAMTGVEHWAGDDLLVAANAYLRRTSGAIIADPAPGPLANRPLFVTSDEVARGIELSARKLAGRLTGLIAYSYGNANARADGRSFVASADRTHALDATASLHFGHVGVGAAYTLTSGAPYTRTITHPTPVESRENGGTFWQEREQPSGMRLPNYSTFDVFLDYSRGIGSATLTGFVTVQNLFGRTNPTWYQLSGLLCSDANPQPATSSCADNDIISAPVKIMPTIGVRVFF